MKASRAVLGLDLAASPPLCGRALVHPAATHSQKQPELSQGLVRARWLEIMPRVVLSLQVAFLLPAHRADPRLSRADRAISDPEAWGTGTQLPS